MSQAIGGSNLEVGWLWTSGFVFLPSLQAPAESQATPNISTELLHPFLSAPNLLLLIFLQIRKCQRGVGRDPLAGPPPSPADSVPEVKKGPW